jgi:hypothetical protein
MLPWYTFLQTKIINRQNEEVMEQIGLFESDELCRIGSVRSPA